MKKLGLLLMLLLAMTMKSHHVFAQSVTITLMPGWNWISVPLMDTLDFETALGSFTPVTGDMIKSQWGNASFRADGYWRGQISQFYPGYGYKYYSNRMMPVMVTFQAQQPAPQVIVTTAEPTDITTNSIICGGNVTSSNGDYVFVTLRGICWSTNPNPTFNDNYVEAGNGLGSFTATITDLIIGTTYYVRAFAVTENGTFYGEQKTFSTRDGIPTLTTDSITGITGTSFSCGGNITDDGGLAITARGVCWSTSPNPTIEDPHTVDGYGMGNFISGITGLNPSTVYYVRAYATTEYATGYGNEINFVTMDIPTGAVNGLFSVSPNTQVYFSQGNLQYQASTNTWRFANLQYDYIGEDNSNISQSYDGWIDLFGWGTSGWNNGNVYYNPYNYQMVEDVSIGHGYGPTNGINYQMDLTDMFANADWGIYNTISNGNNNYSQWRTLTKYEWDYVLNNRTTSFGVRYAMARVDNVYGIILLPDDWNTSIYMLNNVNQGYDFYSNIISASDWELLESHGAVFLPTGGVRHGITLLDGGNYWSVTHYDCHYAYAMSFSEDHLLSVNAIKRYYGLSVRLVCNAE